MTKPTCLVVGPGEEDNVEFGKALERFRVAAKLSRAEAASALEMSSEYVRLVERGRRVFALGTMPTVLTLYDVPYHMEVGRVIFDQYSVSFISRIREARYKNVTEPDRDTQLGRIVKLLATADDAKLHDVYRRLLRD